MINLLKKPLRKTKSLQKTFKISERRNFTNVESIVEERVSDQVDVVIVGGGPAGLAAAIRLKQLSEKNKKELRVCLVEKGSYIGAHILSGAVMEPRAMDELFPNWKELGAPLNVPVTKEKTFFLTENRAIRLPTIPQQQNHGNYIISLSNVCKWMGQQAESLGVEIYPGISASEVLYNKDGSVKGIATGDVGIGKNGKPKENFARGMELHAKVTLFAEGCRGSLTKTLIEKFNLREGVDPQIYGLGLKELWEVKAEKHEQGLVVHTLGWPMDLKTWAGSWMYHLENNMVSIGYVVGLDYKNPYLSPYKEFQRLKHHPLFHSILEGGKPIGYGARALNEGGYQSIPKLIFPGGALIGDTAGFLNVPKIKGSHTAIKSGLVAADAIFEALENVKEEPILLKKYPQMLENSWVYEELKQARNIHPSFKWGTIGGMIYTGIDTFLLRGNAPWTFHHLKPDNEQTGKAQDYKPINYPKPDGIISFDLLTNLARSGTNHNDDQPIHLKLRNPAVAIDINYKEYASPETKYCPAGVYEIVNLEDGSPKLQINSQNCLHCKTCDIKDPTQNIDYTTPEGSGGPNYTNM